VVNRLSGRADERIIFLSAPWRGARRNERRPLGGKPKGLRHRAV